MRQVCMEKIPHKLSFGRGSLWLTSQGMSGFKALQVFVGNVDLKCILWCSQVPGLNCNATSQAHKEILAGAGSLFQEDLEGSHPLPQK